MTLACVRYVLAFASARSEVDAAQVQLSSRLASRVCTKVCQAEPEACTRPRTVSFCAFIEQARQLANSILGVRWTADGAEDMFPDRRYSWIGRVAFLGLLGGRSTGSFQ
jgi:hypothetical protein